MREGGDKGEIRHGEREHVKSCLDLHVGILTVDDARKYGRGILL